MKTIFHSLEKHPKHTSIQWKHVLPAAYAVLAAALWFAPVESQGALASRAPATKESRSAAKSGRTVGPNRWEKLENCTLGNGYMDGDSFHVLHNGRDIVIRLYFVDTPETDDTHPDRNADQAEYFHIPITQVMPVGKMGKKFTESVLRGEKFTVWTRWDDAMGSGQKRYFGVVDIGGRDLAQMLVENGLARVYGASCVTPDGKSIDQEFKLLRQKESRARAKRIGAWSKQAKHGGKPGSDDGGMFSAGMADLEGEDGEFVPAWAEEDLADLKPYSDKWLNVPIVAFLRAETFVNTEQFEDAEIEMRKLLKRFPEHPQKARIEFYLALSVAMQERFPEAIRRFKTWLSAHPKDDPLAPDVQYWLPISMYYGGQHEEALPLFRDYAKNNPMTPYAPEAEYRAACCLYALEDYEGCTQATEAWIAAHPDHYFKFEASIMLGDAYSVLSEFDAAKTAYRRAMVPAAGPFYYIALTQITRIHKALAEPEEYQAMAREYEQYIRDMPNDSNIVDAGYNAGWAFKQLKRPEQAIALYWRMVELFGNNPAWEGFDLIFEGLAALYPKNDPAPFNRELGSRYTKALGAGRTTLAGRLAAEVIKRASSTAEFQRGLASFANRFPQDTLGAETLVWLGRSWIENGMPDTGAAYLRRLLEAYPDTMPVPEAQMLLSQQALARKDYDEAFAMANAVVENAAEIDIYVEATFCRAEALRGLGHHAEAISDYNQILANRSAPRRLKPEALLGIAGCLEAQGEYAQAIAYYQRIYVLYRAYKEQVRLAYLRSGIDFEKLGKKTEAANTYREFLDDRELAAGSAESVEATHRLASLQPS